MNEAVKSRILPRNMADDYHRPYGAPRPISDSRGAVWQGKARHGTARRGKAWPGSVSRRGSRSNVGIEAAYNKKLVALIDSMNKSVEYWLKAAYRAHEPRMAQDGGQDGLESLGADALEHGRQFLSGMAIEELALDRSPADWLKSAFDKLARRWLRQFDQGADKLAEWFTRAVADRSDAQLRQILRQSGLSVPFKMTPAMRDIRDATVHENVALIKSIPRQYLAQVEGSVMRSVTAGRDLATLVTELREHHGVTKRRAALIAMQQNNAATSAFTRARQVEHGLLAVWMHSHAGKEPRPTHLANNGKPYDPAVGWYDPAEKKHIFPGQLINCRCFSRTIIPGF